MKLEKTGPKINYYSHTQLHAQYSIYTEALRRRT